MISFDVNVWGSKVFGVYASLAITIGLVILRFAPGGDGIMPSIIAVSAIGSKYPAGDINVLSMYDLPHYFIPCTGSNCPLWIRDCRHMD
jgi:hypothetical protein